MNVFIDYVGHLDLDHSMYLLFEKRLGAELFRPDVLDPQWQQRLRSYTHPPSLIDTTIMSTPWKHILSFDEFLATDFDIIVTTSWENEEPFYELVRDFKPMSKFIRHIANIHEFPKMCKNILRSTLLPMPGANCIRYIPEHRQEEYKYAPFAAGKIIKSFSPDLPSCPVDYKTWYLFKNELKEFEFKMHGRMGDDNSVHHSKMPQSIMESMFIWHTNGNGCCGYIPRPSLACGKPLIVRLDYFVRGKTICQELLEDGINCIDINPSVRTIEESIRLIREWSFPDIYPEKCRIVHEKFHQDVDFEEEAYNIGKWLEDCREGICR